MPDSPSASSSSTPAPSKPIPKAILALGWFLSVAPCLLLFFSASGKFTKGQDVIDGFTHLGWDPADAVPLGIVEVTATLLYLFPRTAVLGAVLLTGYMGGAIATHARIGEPFIIQAILGMVLWFGLFLRDRRIRALLPIRSKA